MDFLFYKEFELKMTSKIEIKAGCIQVVSIEIDFI
jgi:hypothetical protein